VQHGRAGLQGFQHLAGERVDHLHGVVQRMGEIDPDLAAIGPGDGENRLAVCGGAANLVEASGIDPQHLVTANSGQDKTVARQRPALQMGHFVDRQLLLALAIATGGLCHRSSAVMPSSPNRPAM
jgi:hypothetical protein